jgi:hypothetical protein
VNVDKDALVGGRSFDWRNSLPEDAARVKWLTLSKKQYDESLEVETNLPRRCKMPIFRFFCSFDENFGRRPEIRCSPTPLHSHTKSHESR